MWVTLLVYSALSFVDFSLVFRQCQAREWRKRVLGRDLMFLWRPSSETCRQLAIFLGSWCGVGDPFVHWAQESVGAVSLGRGRGNGWPLTSSLTSVGFSEIQTWVVDQRLVVLLEVHLHEKLRTLPGQSWSGRYFGRSNKTTTTKTPNKSKQTTLFIKGQRCFWIHHRYYICTWLSTYVPSV